MQETKTNQWNQDRKKSEATHRRAHECGIQKAGSLPALGQLFLAGVAQALGWEGQIQNHQVSKIALFYYVQTIFKQTSHSENSRSGFSWSPQKNINCSLWEAVPSPEKEVRERKNFLIP